MFNNRDLLNLEELISQLGKKKVKRIRIDAPGIGRGDYIDQEEISIVRNGVVETQVVEHNRLLDCGHIVPVSNIIAACDICSSLVCDQCIMQCDICGFNVCRYCRKKSIDSVGRERMLCKICWSKEMRKRVASSIYRGMSGFFIARDGD
jgi:hypothetical protein